MSAIGPFAIPILAVGAFAATLGWFGYQHMTRAPAVTPQVAAPEIAKSDASGRATPEAKPIRTASRQDSGKPPQPAAPQPGGPPSASPSEPSPAGSSSAAAVPAAVPAAPVAPAFDVVRVEPTGETVVAGRAAPGASVELVLNGTRHSRVVADPSGLFALVPDPLPPGTHELALQVTNGDGSKIRSPQSVTVVVAANRKDPPLVTITAPGQPAVVLSRPDGATGVASTKPAESAKPSAEGPPAGEGAKPAAESTPPAKQRRTVQIVSVETEGAGRLLVAGSAAPAAVVRLYLNDTFIAPASAGPDGRVSFSIERGMLPGSYKVRLDDIDPVSGQVRSRAEVPFEMPQQVASASASDEPAGATGGEPPAGRLASAGEGTPAPRHPAGPPSAGSGSEAGPAVLVPKINTALVSRGDSLWAISKRAYGEGPRYTVIYGANAKQIRDPDLIYPGQVFVLPTDNSEGAAR